ncbi:MAG: ketoacyl-ACP synthase III [Simkania sp.]|nr:ketoacyl-ACP synthase III [Simkania sp.]
MKARIVATGSYVPERILTNEDLEKMVDTSAEWIWTRTGMKERRIAAEGQFTSDMGYEAAKRSLEKAKISAQEIDLILFATLTPDYLFPSTACLLQARLGATGSAALDIQAACTGYLYGLSLAKALIESGAYRTVLLVAAEKLSSIVNYTDRNTCVLFGDGAAACVIRGEGPGFLIHNVTLGADGEQAELLVLPAGGSKRPASQETIASGLHYIKMEGKEVFKHAVRRMEMASKETLVQSGFTESSLGWMIPHQANIRIIEALAKRFELPMDKVYMTLHKYGNTSASSLGIALDEFCSEITPIPKAPILLTAFGAGLTWGACVLTHGE